jgi:lysophospholipid acyltransferase (LPLAT)-like uncharacterized protein
MKIRSKALEWLFVAGAVLTFKALFRSLRIRQVVACEEANPFSEQCREAFIYAVWHDQLLTALFAGRHRRTVALVSKHQDGSYLATALRMLGIGAVRGSSSRDGANAMRELLRLPPGKNVVITPDGPRGPRRKVKSGLIYLGARTGRPVVPTAFVCSSCWMVRGGWSDLMIPKPFSKLYAVAGPPLIISDSLDRSAADRQLQEAMDQLGEFAESLLQGRERSSAPVPSWHSGRSRNDERVAPPANS